ncbi:MAG: hypothetical protein K0Q70_1289 [Rhodospirillales bacterium]|nr:hypothetical protein [Rhodospirillales bacterium]
MTFDWRHYIAVQLEWADCLIARAQEAGRGNSESDALLGIARTRLQDVQRLATALSRGSDGVHVN